MSSDFIVSLISNYNQHYNNMARVISVLGSGFNSSSNTYN